MGPTLGVSGLICATPNFIWKRLAKILLIDQIFAGPTISTPIHHAEWPTLAFTWRLFEGVTSWGAI